MPKSPPKPEGHDPSNKVIADARAFIREQMKQMNLPHDGKLALATQLHLLSRAALKVKKATRTQHLDAVAFAYAIYAEWRLDPAFERLKKELADSIGKRITKRTDALHVILQAVISYGGGTCEPQTAARRLYSRDAQAIRYLMQNDIAPSTVVHEGLKKGEGLDAWAIRMRPKAPATSEPADPSAAEKVDERIPRQMRHTIAFKTFFRNGTIDEHIIDVEGIGIIKRNQIIELIEEVVQIIHKLPSNAQLPFKFLPPIDAT